MKRQKFKIGSVHGECCDVIGPDGARYRNVVLARYTDDGFTLINAVITKDSAGRVDVAWSHDDLTDGRMEEAALIVKDIAENPTHVFVFVLQDWTDRDATTVSLRGQGALGLVLEYFNDWEQQKLLRRAVDETATVNAAEWLTKSMFYDDEWTEDL